MEERVKQVMAMVFGIDVKDIGANAAPGTIEAWDSMRHMNLVIALEEEFGVRFGEDQIEQLISLPLICLTLRELTGQA
jgi:acyl carrier protein